MNLKSKIKQTSNYLIAQTNFILSIDIFKSYLFDSSIPILNNYNTKETFFETFINLTNKFEDSIIFISKTKSASILSGNFLEKYNKYLLGDFSELLDKDYYEEQKHLLQNIGSFLTKIPCGDLIQKNKDVYNCFDFKINPLFSDHLERVLESIIQYKENSILFASSTFLGYKKYHLSTFNNLSRLIGFMYNRSIINKEEQKYSIKNNYNEEKGTFTFELNNNQYEHTTGDDCVCSYLKKKKKKIKTKLKTDEKQTYIFSVPDYYTYYQKEALKIILQSLNLNNEYPFINELTAITMYYGYLLLFLSNHHILINHYLMMILMLYCLNFFLI